MQIALLSVVKGLKKLCGKQESIDKQSRCFYFLNSYLWRQFDHSDAPEWCDHLLESDHVFIDEETQKTVVVVDGVAHVLTEAFWEAFPLVGGI